MANYLYNGVELPDITPVLEEHKDYPFVAIASGLLGVSGYALLLSENPLHIWMNGESAQLSTPTFPTGYTLNSSNDGWKLSVSTAMYKVAVWANHNLYYGDDEGELSGKLYMEKTDPIPVGGEPIDPTSFLQGWLVGRRLAGMRK